MNLLGAHATRVPSWATPPKTRPYHAPASLPKKTAALADGWEFSGESPKKAREPLDRLANISLPRQSRALPSQSAFSNPHSAIGFTLVELLVSMAILSGLIVLLFSVVDSTTQVWNKSEQRVDAFREARAALFIIARDLQTMVPAPDIGPEPYPTPTTTPAPTPTPVPTPNGVADFKYFFVLNDTQYLTENAEVSLPQPPDGAQLGTRGTFGSGEADALFFLTALPASGQPSLPNPTPVVPPKSDVCLVGYYERYDKPVTGAMTGAPSVFKLYRYIENSDSTFDRLKKFTANPQASTNLINAPSTNDEVLARNVIDFRVRAYDETMTRTVPWNPKKTPYCVDISITAFNYSAANRFIDRADWMNFTSVKNAPSRQTFTTRVYLPRH